MTLRPRAAGPQAGILCICCGISLITVSDTIVRTLSEFYPLPELMFLRGASAVPALVLVAFVAAGEGRGPQIWRRSFLLRATLMAATNVLFFFGLTSLPYSTAIGLFFVGPVLVTLMSATLLRERVGPWRWGAVLVGLAGVGLMVQPSGEAIDPLKLVPLAAAAMYACLQILNRATRHVADAVTMALSGHSGIFVTSIIMGLAFGNGHLLAEPESVSRLLFAPWQLPEVVHLAAMGACGLVASSAVILLFQAYRLAESSLVAPFEYLALPLATLSGFLFWSEVPDGRSIAGIALIAAAGLVVGARERRRLQRIERSRTARIATGGAVRTIRPAETTTTSEPPG